MLGGKEEKHFDRFNFLFGKKQRFIRVPDYIVLICINIYTDIYIMYTNIHIYGKSNVLLEYQITLY